MGNFKDFDLDLKQIKTYNEVGPQKYTEEFWECTKDISEFLSKLACGLPSTECSLSDQQLCRNGDPGIGGRC
ncbi:MAG: hypothetical protein GX053_08390 [Tissierella sp.]|nr:hypothetical protein [Tissierella sp.]